MGFESAEDIEAVAARLTQWTSRGIGVGLNVSALVKRPPRLTLTEVVTTLGRSQHLLWEAGCRRTATMVVVDFDVPGIADAAREVASDPTLRHLNMAVSLSDQTMSAVLSDQASAEARSLARLAGVARVAVDLKN
jgi:hypothetical protein